jgi:hypothetical protein
MFRVPAGPLERKTHMSNMKLTLLVATAMSGAFAGTANAQVLFPAAEVRGVGATTIGDVLVRNLNCIGRPTAGNNKYGTNSGQLLTIEPKVYQPTTPSLTNPVLDCRDLDGFGNPLPDGSALTGQEVQPDFEGRYVGTGSGFGRQMWRLFSNQFTGSNINPFGTWNNVQFAFSETPASASDITAYNANANSVTNKAGPAVQVPFFVIPIALAYNPVYGYKNPVFDGTTGLVVSSDAEYAFNVKSTFVAKDRFGNPIGGLRLSKEAYCKIFNGLITNFNDPLLKTLNGNLDLRDTDDSTTRWAADGVPIRLLGRLDNSGGTDVFTRHLTAVCDTVPGLTPATNKFDQAAEALPFDRTSSINLSAFRSDTAYTPTSTRPIAGTIQSLSGAVYDRVAQVINTTQGAEAAGLFIVSDGSTGVAEGIEIAKTGILKPSASDATVQLNGKFGYVGADFVRPTAGRNLFSSSLQQGTGTTYLPPIALNASKAFGTVLPPQSTASSGAFNVNDARLNSDGQAISRARARDWAAVLYPTSGNTLANPGVGYPITGTAFLLSYTCFADNADRLQLALWVGASLGKVTKKSDNTSLNPNTFKGTGAASFGIFSQSNTAVVPAGWVNAIAETYLKKSTQKSTFLSGPNTGVTVTLGTLNADPALVATPGNGLWIQSKAPLKTTDFDGILTNSESLPNPVCTAGTGA